MPNSSCRLKEVQFTTIEEKRDVCGSHTTHYQVNQHLRKMECFKSFMDETPFNAIISFGKVYFDCINPPFPFFLSKEWISSCAMMILSRPLLPGMKAAWIGEMSLSKKGLI